MDVLAATSPITGDEASDQEIVARARVGDEAALRSIMRRNNQRLFRAARSVVRNDAEAEDIVQETYVRALSQLGSFRGEAKLSTWLTRIALNEALGRKRRQRPTTGLDHLDEEAGPNGERTSMASFLNIPADPELDLARHEMRHLLEEAIDLLPPPFRVVFVLRDVEGLSVNEVATQLELKPQTVKTRHFRARALLRASLRDRVSATIPDLYRFDGARCTGLIDKVILRLRRQTPLQ